MAAVECIAHPSTCGSDIFTSASRHFTPATCLSTWQQCASRQTGHHVTCGRIVREVKHFSAVIGSAWTKRTCKYQGKLLHTPHISLLGHMDEGA